jgi:hypothetical protein
MKLSSRLRAFGLALAAMVLSATAAMAIIDPIPGVDIIVKKNPGGLVQMGTTDAKGQVIFKDLAPGSYTLELNGKTLNLAVGKLDPKGLPHTIGVTFGLPDQKPIVTSSHLYNFPVAANVTVRVAVGDVNGDGDASKTKPHYYVGIVSLVK